MPEDALRVLEALSASRIGVKIDIGVFRGLCCPMLIGMVGLSQRILGKDDV